jgi:predicted aspartyl protease
MNERLESARFPYLPIRVELRGRSYDLEALVDTGFDGEVTVPLSTIGNGAPADYDAGARLADGSRVSVPAYEAEVRIGRYGPFPVAVLALGDEPSVGLGITNRFRLIFDHGERVTLEP